ncbi:MAG: FxsA family protein [bacterium]
MNPAVLFLLIFVVAPLTELYVLIEVGSEIGALATILLSIFTAVLGGWLVRLQGFSVLMRVQESMARGEPPALEMMEGAMLMLTGLALLLPGFITDAAGFLLLVPPVRQALILWTLKRRGVMRPGAPGSSANQQSRTEVHIIDVEVDRDDGPR